LSKVIRAATRADLHWSQSTASNELRVYPRRRSCFASEPSH
jgi:hypothetical protein